MLLSQLPVSTLLLCSIAAAAVLVYVPYLVVGYARFQVGYDMAAPRAAFDKLPAYGQRATWAHQNAFEAFMLYAAAALMAYVTQQDTSTVAIAALTFPIARSLHSVFYILNVPIARSLAYVVGSFCTATLMWLSITHTGLALPH